MNNALRNTKLLVLAAMLTLMTGFGNLAAREPLKVFILAGQSNMVGYANVSTFDSMNADPVTAAILKEMRGPDGTPRVCQKVWISTIGCQGDAYSDMTEKTGPLTAGFGAHTGNIGPEFTFGIYMEKALGKPILLIKTAWGGRSLCVDFRPPSAGPYVFEDYETGQMKQRGDNMEKAKAERAGQTGVMYKHMIEHVRKVLSNPQRVVPSYDPRQGYEIAGFVWFQGFNDLVSDWTYPSGYDLYGKLLTQFIRDVRKDLAVPKLPFVIGVMGIDGMKADGKQMNLRQAMASPAALPEFHGNVTAVQTAPFWVDEETLKKTNGASNQGYHYNGAARIFGPIGKDFAEAMTKMLREQVTALTGPGPYVKLASLAKQIQSGQNLGGAFKTLATKKESTDAAEAAEATTMLAALTSGAQSLLDEALGEKDSDPASAIPKLDLVAKKFSGSDIGNQAKTASVALKKDPKVKKELQATAILQQILTLEATLKPVPGSNDVKSEAFRRQNTAVLQGLVAGWQTLVKRYPETNATIRATAIIDKYR
jgi:alpha-galactosidase